MKRKTIWVKYKNIDGKYERESKIPQKIWKDKFNSEFHRKLLFENIYQNILDSLNKNGKTDWKWIIGLCLAIPGSIYATIKTFEFLNK